jgi:hypothetical protein
MRYVKRLICAAAVTALALPLAAQQAAPAQPPPLTSLPGDLEAYVRQLGEMAKTDRTGAQRAVASAGRLVPKATLEGENVAFGALLAIRGHQYKPALDLALQYLEKPGTQKELALAVAIEAASWINTEYARARRLYADFAREFPRSRERDPLRAGAPLRVTVEESMARVAYLESEDSERAATHYQHALKAIEDAGRNSVPLEDFFRLRWYYADAIAAVGRSEEALQYLYETRPVVKGKQLLELQLEDFILFKETDKLLNQAKYAEARAILERRLPEFEPAPVNKRRITKLLDRVKLVGAPAPELAANVRWIGGGPYTLPDLRGRVVMLEFFTSG